MLFSTNMDSNISVLILNDDSSYMQNFIMWYQHHYIKQSILKPFISYIPIWLGVPAYDGMMDYHISPIMNKKEHLKELEFTLCFVRNISLETNWVNPGLALFEIYTQQDEITFLCNVQLSFRLCLNWAIATVNKYCASLRFE